MLLEVKSDAVSHCSCIKMENVIDTKDLAVFGCAKHVCVSACDQVPLR